MSRIGCTVESSGFRFVIMVASLGGLAPMTEILSQLPATFPVPVLIVQHRTALRDPGSLAKLLQQVTPLPVRPGRPEVTPWRPGVTVMPAATVATIGSTQQVDIRPKHAGDLPGDTLLASAAQAAAPGSGLAVILSGMQRDGSIGICAVKRHGGRVLVQDPATARAPDMPVSAIATGCVDFVLSARHIGAALVTLTMAPGGAQLFAVPAPHWAAYTA
jgi:two-component system chemotaxis response regulator CheB